LYVQFWESCLRIEGAQKALAGEHAEDDFRRGVYHASGKQMRAYGSALPVGNGDMEMGSVPRQLAGEGDDLEVASQDSGFRAVGVP